MRKAAAILEALGRGMGEDVETARELSVSGEELVSVLSSLKSLGDFILLDIDAIDRPDGYHLAYRLLDRGGEGEVGLFTVKVVAERPGAGESVAGAADGVAGEPSLPSVVGVWKAADVLEREVWDLMGVRFEGRSGLTRILCKDDFEGHPLRKDFVVRRGPRFADGKAGREAGLGERSPEGART